MLNRSKFCFAGAMFFVVVALLLGTTCLFLQDLGAQEPKGVPQLGATLSEHPPARSKIALTPGTALSTLQKSPVAKAPAACGKPTQSARPTVATNPKTRPEKPAPKPPSMVIANNSTSKPTLMKASPVASYLRPGKEPPVKKLVPPQVPPPGMPTPANDDCANAQAIGDVTNLAFSTTAATHDQSGSCISGPNIWYVYTATCSGTAIVSLCGSSYDTKLAVYDGYSCSPLPTQINCNDDYCSLQSQITFTAVSGHQYLIEVGGYSNVTGSGVLTTSCVPATWGACCNNNPPYDCQPLNESDCDSLGGHTWKGAGTTCTPNPCYPPPPNDDCTGAPVINTFPSTVSGTTKGATPDYPDWFNMNAVWYRFDLPYTCNDLTVDFCPTTDSIWTVEIVLFNSCPPSPDDYIVCSGYSWNYSCPNGSMNPKLWWYNLPAGSYWFPVCIWDEGYNPFLDFSFTVSVDSCRSNRCVGYWSFDEDSGSVLHDYSGNGNDAVIWGPTWVTNGISGSALDFDGIDDCAWAFCVNSPYLTVSAWVYYHQFCENVGCGPAIVSCSNDDPAEGWSLYQNTSYPFNRAAFFVTMEGQRAGTTSSLPLDTGQWYNLAMTWDGHAAKLYINGQFDSEDDHLSGTLTPSGSALMFGENHFDGLIDEVRIYRRALSAEEIQYLYDHPGGIANFSAEPDSGFRPLSVHFTDLSVGSPTSWFWNFGDGITDTVQNPVHVYSDTGQFNVKFVVSDSLRSDSIIKPDYITVFETLTVDFTAQPTHGRKPLSVSFQPIYNVMPESVTWYFGDEQTSNQLNPVHKYTEFGNYDVKLVAELFGYKDSLTKEDYIQVSDIKAGFGVDKRCGPAPLTVAFSDSSTGTNPTIGWHWDFGDGDTSNQQNPTHQFTTSRAFDITLSVSDSIGADTLKKQDYITTQDSVSADFFGLPNSGRSPLTVMFEPILSGIANHYFWDFGDGETDTLRNPIHIYTSQGKYDVKLKVSLELDDCNQVDSIIKEDYVVVNDLEAKFSASPTAGVAPLSVQFTDESSGNPNTWFWDFGDGATSIEQSPQHQFDTAGVYDVFLRVNNALGQDSLLKLSLITVDTPYVDLYAELYGPDRPRPGFIINFYFVWTNIGTIPAQNCTMKMLLPSQMVFSQLYDPSGSPFPGYYFVGDTMIAPLGTIDPSDWYGGYVYAHGSLPSSVPIGTVLVCKMWLTSSTLDRDYSNNYDSVTQVVIGSWDPNDKLASPEGEGISHSIKPDQRLAYTIQFENKPEATAEAIYIRVVDTLDQDLDWGSLAIGAMSHPDKCRYEFDPYTGVIVWSCDSIMLPPNHNPPEGEGYFTYSISPKPDLPNGRELINTAWIRFDYNAWLQAPEEGPVIRTIKYPFIYGDVNGDGKINASDVVYLINYLFIAGPAPIPIEAGDCNCDGHVNASDVVYLINYLFISGPPPGC